jgi:hypothetical protein
VFPTIRSAGVFLVLLMASASAGTFEETYEAGVKYFDADDLVRARVEFLHAYEMRPEPIVLYNVAQTYRLQGIHQHALEYYKRFLASANISEKLRKNAEAYVAGLEAQLRPNPSDAEAQGSEAESEEHEAERPRPLRRIPLGTKIAAGVTGAGLITSIVFTTVGLSAERDLKNNPMASNADANRVERYQTLINASWGITGAAALTAAVIYFATPIPATDRGTVVIAPTHDGGWATSLTGTF